MRTSYLLVGAAVLIFTSSLAGAAPSLSSDVSVGATSSKKIRFADAKGISKQDNHHHPHHGIAWLIHLLKERCEGGGPIMSQSRVANNGFGNCGGDGVPGKSGKQDINR